MSMFGQGSDYGFLPSYYLAEITEVNLETHTVSVVLLRGQETYQNVMLIRDPGNYNLPKVGDIGVVLWDNRNRPIIIGTYPTYHNNKLETNENYKVEQGERLVQSEFGQKLLFNKRGEIILTNWLSQGLTIDQDDGLTTLTGDTVSNDTAGVDKRSGYTKRYSPVLGRGTTVKVTTPSDVVASTSVGTTSLIEDATIIEDPITGIHIYENKIGNSVIIEDTALSGEVKTVATLGVNPLRSQTKYFDPSGLNFIEVAIDIYGNASINIPAGMALTSGVNIEGAASKFAMDFFNIDFDNSSGIGSIKIGKSLTPSIGTVELGSNPVKQFCNNLPACLFTGTSHVAGNTTVKV